MELINFLISYPLYKKQKISEEEMNNIKYSRKLERFFCPSCNKVSVFKRVSNNTNKTPCLPSSNYGGYFSEKNYSEDYENIICIRFQCSKNSTHEAVFYLYHTLDYVIKIGQYPSFEEINEIKELNNYKKILSDTDYDCLNKAIGLYANGLAIPAFTYLRRILENFIIETQNLYILENKCEKTFFENKRIKDRIKILENYLPDFFVKNNKIYSILSKGIHELEEDICHSIFPFLKMSLFEIINDLNYKKNYAKNSKELKKDIENIKNKMVGGE